MFKKIKKFFPIIYIFLLLILLTIFLLLSGCSNLITGASVSIDSYVEDEGSINLYFCPHEDCETAFISFLNSANQSLDCALFEINHPKVQKMLLKKNDEINVRIVTDDTYLKKFNQPFVKADKSGLMHNKFCIIDDTFVSTGSMNPTINGIHKNNNNLLIIKSKTLATNFADEFEEMWNDTFKKGTNTLNPEIKIGDVRIQNYFCPDDHCAEHVKEELMKAKESIYFMVFSFTHQGISNILLMKHLDGLTVEGLQEARQASVISQYKRIDFSGIDIMKDTNPNNMHHKVFIIDNKTVITGSFNPSEGGDSKNDENILIIRNEEIARRYLEEYERLRGES